MLKPSLVPRTSTPNPQRFSKTCVYNRGFLIIYRVNMTAQLIVFWSKALLRDPHARSSLEEMTTDTAFQRYIPDTHSDTLVPPDEIRRHILCTGPWSQSSRNTVGALLTLFNRPSLSHPRQGAPGERNQRCGNQPSRTTFTLPLRFGPSSSNSFRLPPLTL